jgi:hypothetical protein
MMRGRDVTSSNRDPAETVRAGEEFAVEPVTTGFLGENDHMERL